MNKKIPLFKSKITFSDAYQVFKTVRSQFIGPGKQTSILENKLSEIYNAPVITTNSGTTALFLTLLSLKDNIKNTVLFPAYGFIAGANAAMLAGYKVKLVDINPETLCMDSKKLKEALESNPDVNSVIFVAHNGYNGKDILDIKKLCKDYNVNLIEDAACGIGTFYETVKPLGNYGDYGILSFSVPKTITGGQGGAIICNNNISKPLYSLVDHGGNDWRKTGIHTSIGGNFRLTDIQAKLILNQLRRLDHIISERAYQLHFLDSIKNLNMFIPESNKYNFEGTWYNLAFEDNLIDTENKMIYLLEHGVSTKKYYRPLSHHPIFKENYNDYPNAEKMWEKLFYLPSGPGIKISDLKYIKKIMEKY